jgi:uncharacterized membrane protein YfcA
VFAAPAPHPSLSTYVLLALAGFGAGVVNSIAGGGGFLTFPALIRAGLMPIEANTTGTVGLWPGQLSALAAYRDDLTKNLRMVAPCMAVALIGGFAGAWTLLHNSQGSFLRLVPYLFLLGSISFAVSAPVARAVRRRASTREGKGPRIALIPLLVSLLAITFYIGYFGAGAGLLTLTALALCGVEKLAEMNALKLVVTLTANGVAVITFIVERRVDWNVCWLMMLACILGGYVGARNARRISDKILRPIIIALGFGLFIYFFFHRSAL